MFQSALKVGYRCYLQCFRRISTVIGRLKLRILGRAKLGRNVTIGGRIRVRVFPGGQLIIGDGVRFQSGFRYNPVGADCVTSIWVGARGRLEIRDGAGLSGATIVCFDSVTIGERTLIGGGVRVYDTDFHALDPAVRRTNPGEVKTAPVTIGAECFIGAYSLVLKGVTIGDQAVIGAGSVVAKDVPAGEIWAGNPAKFIRPLRRDGT